MASMAMVGQSREKEMNKEDNSSTPVYGERLYKLRCSFGMLESTGHIILWIILTIISFGIALLFFPYYLNKNILNKTELLTQDGRCIGYLRCRFDIISSIGHVILWGLLIIFTIGLAAFFYLYRVIRVVLNETYIEYY